MTNLEFIQAYEFGRWPMTNVIPKPCPDCFRKDYQIEKLRADNELLAAGHGRPPYVAYELITAERDRLTADNERLTDKAENWQRIATEVTAIEHARRVDNERLRAENAELKEALHWWQQRAPALEPKP